MFVSTKNIPLSRMRVISEVLRCQFMFYYGRVNVTAKRGSILQEMVTNKDKRKNWHLNIMPSKPKVRIFDKIHKPHRRRAVLNALFIKNITDVISTGEIAPEISNYAVEITGVQISPCYKILNVFWQVPVSSYDASEDVEKILTIAAPKIRAELISRNVLGRVPIIFFLRDGTNARIAAFEEAMKKLDTGGSSEPGVVLDDSFTKDIYSFKDSKKTVEKPPEAVKIDEAEVKKDELTMPKIPLGMKCNVFGLDHEAMMEKVLTMRKRKKSPPEQSAVIPSESVISDDLFSKIPGVCFKASSSEPNLSRAVIFKKFHIERKMLKERNKIINSAENHQYRDEDYDCEETDYSELDSYNDDFVEDETIGKQ